MGALRAPIVAVALLLAVAAATATEGDFSNWGATHGRGLLQTQSPKARVKPRVPGLSARPEFANAVNAARGQAAAGQAAAQPSTGQAAPAQGAFSTVTPKVPRPVPGGAEAAAAAKPTVVSSDMSVNELLAAANQMLKNMPPAPPRAAPKTTRLDPSKASYVRLFDRPRCSLAKQLLGQCPPPPPPPPSPPPRPPAPPPPPPNYTYMEENIRNHTCNATLLPNGGFELGKPSNAKLVGWAKIKENKTVGGGSIYDGSIQSYTGFPGYPFDNPNRYFRTRPVGNIAFVLVNNAPFNVTSKDQYLYFDWFVDNPWPYWFVAQSMSLMANNSQAIMHQARVDLYDYDKLTPPGNYTQLAEMLFDKWDSQAGEAYLGPILPPEVIAMTPNLRSMATEATLAPYVGKRVLVAFRYSTNVNFLSFGIDNVMVVDCDGKNAQEYEKPEEERR